MSIASSELKWYRSKTVTNTIANGGKMSKNVIASNVRGNVFPDVSEAERNAGMTRYRKLFGKVENVSNETLFNSYVHLTTITPADDYVTLIEGTQINTENDLDDYDREYGASVLAVNADAGSSELSLTLEHADMDCFQDTDTIWIGDGTNQEYHHNVTVAQTGTAVTITLDTGDQLANSFTTNNTYVASCIDFSDVEGSVSEWLESSGAGTFNETTYPVIVNNVGGVYEDWTITFTSATAFSCSGAELGVVGTGTTANSFSPNNADFSVPYFTLNKDGFGGTWANGNTIQFRTHPASVPVWFKQVVPTSTLSYSGNNFTFRLVGESA